MSDKPKAADGKFRRLHDTSVKLRRLDPARVAAALGAEPAAERIKAVLAPITLFAVRQELARRLQSSGGRPALAGTTRRAKIPLGDEEWSELEEMADALATEGFAPSAGQVASVLLTLSMRAVAAEVAKVSARDKAKLGKELAALATERSRPRRPKLSS